MNMYKDEKIQGLQRMILFIVESFATVSRFGFLNMKPSSGRLNI